MHNHKTCSLDYVVKQNNELTSLIITRTEEDDDLLLQIDVFEDQRNSDEDEYGGINLNNHNDVFQAIFQKVYEYCSLFQIINNPIR